MRTLNGLAGLLFVLVAVSARGEIAAEKLPYPQGRQFPVMLYGVTEADIPNVATHGFNILHSYARPPHRGPKPWDDVSGFQSWLQVAGKAGMFACGSISEEDLKITWEESDIASQMGKLAGDRSIAWWNLPEEMTWTDEGKFGRLKQVSSWARKYDPQRRPTFEYLAGNYIAYDLKNYAPFVDVIGIGSYIDYNEQPRQWMRWAVKQTILGIEEAGYTVGPDYLGKQRVPAATLQCFVEGGTHRANGPETYHDVWNAVCAGAKAIVVFSWNHRNELPPEVYQAYVKAAKQLTETPNLGQAILFGTPMKVSAEIAKGPKTTPPFDSWGGKGITFPSINLLAVEHEGHRFIIAVNDTAEPVSARFAGLPANESKIVVIDEERALTAVNGAFNDEFEPWGVHIYRLP